MSRRFRLLPALLLTLLTVGGCATQAARPLIAEPPPLSNAGVAARHDIFIATTRHPATNPRAVFDGRRSPERSFARIDVTVPASHKVGVVERPRGTKPDPSRFFTARSISAFDGPATFARQVSDAANAAGGRALVFVHGYNTPFDEAVYRATQIVHDAAYTGAPVLFTWASGGRAVDYVYDRDSANAARDALEALLVELAQSGIRRIDIVGHSMGAWLTMEALRGLAIGGDRDLGGKLGDVVLASPDIDVDVFKSQMRRYGLPDRPFVVLLSDDDRALRFSSLISGRQPRLGDYRNAADIAGLGLVVVDLTNVRAGDRYNHAKFADNPALITLLGERLRLGDTLTEADAANAPQMLIRGVGTAAEIIVTTPFRVINMAVGG